MPPTDRDVRTRIDQPSFTVRVGLGDIPASVKEVRDEIGDRLDHNQPHLRRSRDGSLVLRLTVVAADLWLSVLLAMAAVTSTGYQPQWIEARPGADGARPGAGWTRRGSASTQSAAVRGTTV